MGLLIVKLLLCKIYEKGIYNLIAKTTSFPQNVKFDKEFKLTYFITRVKDKYDFYNKLYIRF